MYKFYVFIVVCLAFSAAGSAQNRYIWNGSVNNDWNTAANWTLNGSPAASAPGTLSDSAIFNAGTPVVTLGGNVSIAALIVTNSTSAKITGITAANVVLTVNSTDGANPGLRIDGGSKLESDAATNVEFTIQFAAASKGTVNGEWLMSGNVDNNALADFFFAGNAVRLTFTNGSKLTVSPTGFLNPNEVVGDVDLVFQAGSTLDNQSDNPSIPEANYDPASTIILSGVLTGGPSLEETTTIGNLTYNCAGQTADFALELTNGFNIKGTLAIQSTNGKNLTLLSAQNSTGSVINVGINGNFNISGNSNVIISRGDAGNKIPTLTVQGDVNAGGNTLNLQAYNGVVQPTTLVVRSNLNHTAGTISATSTKILQTSNLFNIEFNGSTSQNISSTGIIDNPGNQITLRMNNPLGVTLQTSVQTGRIVFVTGNINTSLANVLTLRNTSNDPHVLFNASPSGYINGPYARMMATTSPVIFPTFLGGQERDVTVNANSAAANTFLVGINSGGNGGSFQPPIAGMANYYWTVTHPSGTANATITMHLADVVPAASATDTLIPIAYDGSIWNDARGSTGNYIFPGNSPTGDLVTGSQSSFTAFGIGYAINSALPITLTSFTGRKVQSSAELAWTITDNSTPEKFEVIKSVDGVHFTSLGSQIGVVGKLNYGYSDASLVAGNNFYRLKMYDKDGSVTYSNIIVVMNGSKGVMISSMIPTVVHDRARLNISASIRGNMQLVVTDITGRVMLQQVASIDGGNQEVWLNAGSLAAGMYQVTGYINGERTSTFRFIKQ